MTVVQHNDLVADTMQKLGYNLQTPARVAEFFSRLETKLGRPNGSLDDARNKFLCMQDMPSDDEVQDLCWSLYLGTATLQ